MRYFVQVTAVIAVGIVILIALAFLLKIFVIAAIIAAVVVGVVAVRRLFVRRNDRVRSITYRR